MEANADTLLHQVDTEMDRTVVLHFTAAQLVSLPAKSQEPIRIDLAPDQLFQAKQVFPWSKNGHAMLCRSHLVSVAGDFQATFELCSGELSSVPATS